MALPQVSVHCHHLGYHPVPPSLPLWETLFGAAVKEPGRAQARPEIGARDSGGTGGWWSIEHLWESRSFFSWVLRRKRGAGRAPGHSQGSGASLQDNPEGSGAPLRHRSSSSSLHGEGAPTDF